MGIDDSFSISYTINKGNFHIHHDFISHKDIKSPLSSFSFSIYFRRKFCIFFFCWIYSFISIILPNWPNDPPNVKILDKIWHPDIELVIDGNQKTGRVSVSTLTNSYVNRLTLKDVVLSLQFIWEHPDYQNILNVEAAEEHDKNYESFKWRVKTFIDIINDDDNYEDD